jgi:hypothetical protein
MCIDKDSIQTVLWSNYSKNKSKKDIDYNSLIKNNSKKR